MGMMKTVATARIWNPRLENLRSDDWWMKDLWKAQEQERHPPVEPPQLSVDEINALLDQEYREFLF